MSEDTLLIQQTLAGDEQAFHHLAVKYQSAIYSLILSYVRNPDDAQEIMQDVFLKAYQGLSSLRQSERFRFWLYQLARNQCQDWKRKNQAEFQQLTDKTADDAYPVDELLILRETLARIMQAIDELPETEKQILKERYLDDSSYAEMQAKHGLSYKALNMRLLRAKQKVRARVEKLLAGIGIFSWHDALNKMLLGGVEAVKIGIKTKLIVAGIALIIILGGTGVFIWHSHQSTTDLSDNSVNQITQNVSKQIPAKSINAMNAKVTVADKTPEQETDESKETMGTSQPEAASDASSKAKVSETKDGKITISPKLESAFKVYKDYRDKIRTLNKENEPFDDRYGKLCQRDMELKDAINVATEEDEKSKLRKELQQVEKEKGEVAAIKAPILEERDRLTEEMNKYMQAHLETTIMEFEEGTYRGVYETWAKEQ